MGVGQEIHHPFFSVGPYWWEFKYKHPNPTSIITEYRAMSDFNTIPPIESNLPPAQSDDLFVSAMDSPTDSGLDGVGSDLTESDRPKTGSDTMEDLSLQVSTAF